MSQRRRPISVEDEDDEADDGGESEVQLGYRGSVARPLAKSEPEGEILDATPEDLRALGSAAVQARNRLVGMLVAAALVIHFVVPGVQLNLPGVPVLPLVITAAAVGLALYARASFRAPEGIGPAIVRLEPEDAIGAGRFLAITLVLQPPGGLEIDRLTVRLVARKTAGGGPPGEVIHSVSGTLAAEQSIEPGRAVRLQTTLFVPEDAPPTSSRRGISWRVEISLDDPAVFTRQVPIRVLPLAKRLRERAERLRSAGRA
jgi:hypothetical protein